MAEEWGLQDPIELYNSLNKFCEFLNVSHPRNLKNRFDVLRTAPVTLNGQQCICSAYGGMSNFTTFEPVWAPLCVSPAICIILGKKDVNNAWLINKVRQIMHGSLASPVCPARCIHNRDPNSTCFPHFRFLFYFGTMTWCQKNFRS